jgi:pimeloyl-ACP methyl ester carboxylesterase
MPFTLSLAVDLGGLVQCAYDMNNLPDPTKVTLSDPDYSLVNVVYGNNVLVDVDGFVSFGFIAQSSAAPYSLVVSIRGTEDMWDWISNFAFIRKACPLAGAPPGAETEDGFTNLYQTLRVGPVPAATPLKTAVQNLITSLGATNVAHVYVCGHSLGGALATLAAADLAGLQLPGALTIYTFASPAVGEKTFADWFDGLVPDSYRIYNGPDIVPTLPPSLIGYTHVDEPFEINSGPSVVNSVVCHHSLSTYLHTLDASQPLEAGCSLLALPAASP